MLVDLSSLVDEVKNRLARKQGLSAVATAPTPSVSENVSGLAQKLEEVKVDNTSKSEDAGV